MEWSGVEWSGVERIEVKGSEVYVKVKLKFKVKVTKKQKQKFPTTHKKNIIPNKTYGPAFILSRVPAIGPGFCRIDNACVRIFFQW